MESLLIPILLIIAGLMVGVLFKSLSKYIKLPYTVILFAVGIAIGTLYRFNIFENIPSIKTGISGIANLDPDFILYVFLPILIFEAAYEMNLHVFKKTLVNATILAGPGLVLCMFLTGGLIFGFNYLISGNDTEGWCNWTYALMFGALISATDPVAVVALLQELKTSKKFSTLVDGESLLNDGTGIVCFMLFYSKFTENVISMNPFLYYAIVCVGSIVIGYIMARLTLLFITRFTSEEVVQNSVMIISAYITFIIAQHTFDISGVIALVAYGIIVAQKGKPLLKPQVNEFICKFWELLSYIANTLIFIIVGLIIATKITLHAENFIFLAIVYVGIMLIRYIMIFFFYPILKITGYGISKRESIILGWGGLRGALAMALALMVYNTESIPLNIREDILFLTAGVITLTLCINATTSKLLLQKLGLIKGDSSSYIKMQSRIHNNIIRHDNDFIEKLKKTEAMQEADWDTVSQYIPKQNIIFDSEEIEDNDTIIAEIRQKTLNKARETANTIYENGIISRLSYNLITNYYDELCDSDGTEALDKKLPLLSSKSHVRLIRLRKVQLFLHFFPNANFTIKYYSKIVSQKYDIYRGYIIIQERCLKLIDDIDKSDIIDQTVETEILNTIRAEINANIDRAKYLIGSLQENFPRSFKNAVTSKAVRMLLAEEMKMIRQMFKDGLITEDEFLAMTKKINNRRN